MPPLYLDRFGEDSVVNEDINKVLEQAEAGEIEIPDVQMVVGGFPCQDYSVARPLNQAHGIEGKRVSSGGTSITSSR